MSPAGNLAAKIERVAVLASLTEPYVDEHGNTKWRQQPDSPDLVSAVIGGMGALASYVVVDQLDAIELAAEASETTITPTEQRTAQAPRLPAESWRRWPTDRLAKFVIHGIAKVMPQFWWCVDYADALTVAANIIDNFRGVELDIDGAPPELDWDQDEFVATVRYELIDHCRPYWFYLTLEDGSREPNS